MKMALLLLALAAVVSLARLDPQPARLATNPGRAKIVSSVPVAKPSGLTVTPVGDLAPLLGDASPGPALFRRPAPPAELLAQQQAKNALAYDLSGISGKGEIWTAFFRNKETNQVIVARVGQMLGQWRVEAIDGGCATIKQGKKKQRLCV